MNDFMEFSKIKIEKDYVDVNMLLEELESDLNLLIKGKNVLFEMNFAQNEDDVYIMGDYSRLKQVFVNLIKNSLEAMSGHGKILVNAKIQNKYYYIEVIDDGSGMDKETLSHMKEMFFTTKVKGTGLGVSLSNEIIKAHEGTLDYFSELGKGTKVVVKLPITML